MRLSSEFEILCEIVWCNKPQVNAVLEELKGKGLNITKSIGKGKDLWIAMGIASLELYAFAVHDADIVSYSGMLPTNSSIQWFSQEWIFPFLKDTMLGSILKIRKCMVEYYRLFINPLLDALQKKLNHSSTFIDIFIPSDTHSQVRLLFTAT